MPTSSRTIAPDAILDRLSGLDESRERAEHAGREALRPREEQLLAAVTSAIIAGETRG
jgi:hypothetical protein